MNATERPRNEIAREKAMALVAVLAAVYPAAFCIYMLEGGFAVDFNEPITLVPVTAIIAATASVLYHLAIWPSLKYPVFKDKRTPLDQLDEPGVDYVRIPIAVRAFGFVTIGLEAMLAAGSIWLCWIILSFGGIKNWEDIAFIANTPATIIAGVLVARTVLKTRMAPPNVLEPTQATT